MGKDGTVMIADERMNAFIDSLDTGNTPFLNEIENEAKRTNVPIIRTQVQSLIKLLLAVRKPASILEVGCAVGFSTLDKITLLEGDAADILKDLDGTFDLIFMDAAKGQYIHFLPDVLRLLSEGGILLSDNVLQDGDIIESRFAVTRRNRTIHSRMREYLYELKHHQDLETVILPVGDGVTVSVHRT